MKCLNYSVIILTHVLKKSKQIIAYSYPYIKYRLLFSFYIRLKYKPNFKVKIRSNIMPRKLDSILRKINKLKKKENLCRIQPLLPPT